MDVFAQVNKRNIVNSDDWGDAEYLAYFQDRLSDMRAKKQPFETDFKTYESQFNALTYYDNDWMLQVNQPLEANIIEMYMWRTNWKINYDIIADWQTNIDELQGDKYALQFFLDWNDKNNFWKENKDFRMNKALYWTWIFYTWLRSYKDIRFKLKEDVEIQSWTDTLDKNKFDKVENETWFFFPKSIHPMDYYPDDKAYWQTDIQNAEDCIFKEKVTYSELKMRYGDNKAFKKLNEVTTWTDQAEKNDNSQSIQQDQIILHYYFHRIYKTMLVVANETTIMYNWIYLYNDWKLPFVMAQHYTNPNCIWWNWVPAKIGYIKAYENEIWMNILTGSNLASWVTLLWSNDDFTTWFVPWNRSINYLTTTWWAERVQQLNTSPNLWFQTTVLDLLDRVLIRDTWDNLMSPVDAWSDKLWIVEIQEARKEVRQSAVDENYNIALDDALTMTLQRIKDFAPSLLSEKIKDSEWKLIKTIFPAIKIQWYTVSMEDKKTIFTEDIWKMWYFGLVNWDDLNGKKVSAKIGWKTKEVVWINIKWLWVKITTTSTSSSLPVFERAKVTEYINNMMNLGQLAQFNPEIAQKLSEEINVNELLSWMWDAYWYDTKLKANTEKDKIEEENKKLKSEIIEKLKINPPQDENIWENQGIPTQNPALWWVMWWDTGAEAGNINPTNPLPAIWM